MWTSAVSVFPCSHRDSVRLVRRSVPMPVSAFSPAARTSTTTTGDPNMRGSALTRNFASDSGQERPALGHCKGITKLRKARPFTAGQVFRAMTKTATARNVCYSLVCGTWKTKIYVLLGRFENLGLIQTLWHSINSQSHNVAERGDSDHRSGWLYRTGPRSSVA